MQLRFVDVEIANGRKWDIGRAMASISLSVSLARVKVKVGWDRGMALDKLRSRK